MFDRRIVQQQLFPLRAINYQFGTVVSGLNDVNVLESKH
jgi:hypothetical protein